MTESSSAHSAPSVRESSRSSVPESPDVSPRPRARRIAVAVDVVVLTVREGFLNVLLVRRLARHHKGEWALPGGFVDAEESLDAAARRELREETGLDLDPRHVEQFRAYGDPDRDDRKDRRVITVAYLAIQPFYDLPEPAAGTDAAEAVWVPVDEVFDGRRPLAFDHGQIVEDAVERVGAQLEYTALATAFVAERFTEADLRAVYDAVWGLHDDPLDAPNFHRSLHTLKPPMVEPLLETRPGERGRPAALYSSSHWVDDRGPLMRLDRPLARPKQPRPGRSAPYKRRPQ
jgi:8-oxo-dGTP diphosphatase